ncbi:MAG TPA: redoxin domain-containing protein [Bacteroidota bacterium]|nr:redoxin domain-containing protein [Bacteroidota bacterium]
MLLSRHIENDRRAPELYGSFWFNSKPLTLRSMQGDVVLLFFWDHTSISSLRILKHINRLHEQYGSIGLRVIGVQVSEYALIRDPVKKEEIIKSYGIKFPIVADDEHRIADSYRIGPLPIVVLIAPSGDIYDTQEPKGSISRLERSVQYLMRQAGYFGELPFVEYTDYPSRDFSVGMITPDFDLGYIRGSLGNSEGYSPELPAEYHDPEVYVDGKFYAEGVWIAGRTSFAFAGESPGYLLFSYTGNDVGIVIGNENGVDTVAVTVDGSPIEAGLWGSDIRLDDAGSTVVRSGLLRSQHLISSRAVSSHIVKLIPKRSGTTFYGVAFVPFEPISEADKASFRNN